MMAPPVPTGTSTRLAMVLPAVQLRLEALGRAVPFGKTARKLPAVVLVTVTFRTTAMAPAGASGAAPVTERLMDFAAPSRAIGAPVPLRVSRTRAGVTGV